MQAAVGAMYVAPDAAHAEAAEGRALLKLADAAQRWAELRSPLVFVRNRAAHQAQDEDDLDSRLTDAVTQVRELAAREIARRRALPRFEALDSGGMITTRGSPPEVQWFVMYAVGHLSLTVHEIVLVEALAAPYGARLRVGLTWWQDPDTALNTWSKSVEDVLGKDAAP